jgi:hypothetical protein
MTRIIDPAQLPMREEVGLLEKIQKASKVFSREAEEIMEAAKVVQLTRIANALENLAAPPKPKAPSCDHDADHWAYDDFDPLDDPE